MDWMRTLIWMLRGQGWLWLVLLAWLVVVYLFVPLTATLPPLGAGVLQMR